MVTIVGISLNVIAACALVAGGMALVHTGWRAQRHRGAIALCGASLVAASTGVWNDPSSAEQRIALTLLVAMLMTLGMLGRAAMQSPARKLAGRERLPAQARTRPADRREAIGLALLYGPITGISALFFCSGLFAVLRAVDADDAAIVATCMLAFPLSWSVIAGLAGLGDRLSKVATLVLAPGITGAAVLFLT